MNEKARYMTFYENWVEVMEMCTPEEWYELTKIITNLRFKNIDTDPKTLTNIKIKMAWNLIRPSILKSNRNTRYQDNKAAKNADITPNNEFNTTVTTGIPTTEIEEYTIETDISDAANDFLDENEEFLRERINAIVDGKLNPTDKDKQYWLTEGYRTIKEKCSEMGYDKGTPIYQEITGVLRTIIDSRINAINEYKED